MHEFMTKMVFYFMKTIADWHVYINGIESFINSLLQRKANLLEYFFFWPDTLLSKYEGSLHLKTKT